MLSESYLKHDEVCLGDDACAGFQFSPLLARQGTQDPSQGNYTINLTLRQFDTPWENGTLYEDYTHYFEEGLCQFIGYDSIDNGLPICQNETGLPAVNYDASPDEFSSQRVTAFVQNSRTHDASAHALQIAHRHLVPQCHTHHSSTHPGGVSCVPL